MLFIIWTNNDPFVSGDRLQTTTQWIKQLLWIRKSKKKTKLREKDFFFERLWVWLLLYSLELLNDIIYCNIVWYSVLQLKANDAKHFALYIMRSEQIGEHDLLCWTTSCVSYHQKNESKMISNASLIRLKLHIIASQSQTLSEPMSSPLISNKKLLQIVK